MKIYNVFLPVTVAFIAGFFLARELADSKVTIDFPEGHGEKVLDVGAGMTISLDVANNAIGMSIYKDLNELAYFRIEKIDGAIGQFTFLYPDYNADKAVVFDPSSGKFDTVDLVTGERQEHF